jgi:hypothetical protein
VSAADRGRERAAWIAVTVVLAIALAWTALIALALATGACTHCPPGALAVGRALGRGLGLAVRAALPPALAAAAVAMALAGLVLRGEGPPQRVSRHG